nr:biofilm regulation phosphoprotein SiaC [uncultured Holophaga sp.]
MENLVIPSTASSPLVDFDAAQGLLCLSGESYPENSLAFFRPVLAWVRDFLASSPGRVTLELRLSYLNTSSIKALMDLLDELEEAHRTGRVVTVNWHYDQGNDRALQLAEEFREDLTLPFFTVPLGV